jgi:hypothetical protein
LLFRVLPRARKDEEAYVVRIVVIVVKGERKRMVTMDDFILHILVRLFEGIVAAMRDEK